MVKMELNLKLLLFFCIFHVVSFVTGQISTTSSTVTFNQTEYLDEFTSLGWNVDLEAKTIVFTIAMQSNGTASYVALGLTKKGRLQQGDDVILVGVGNDGNPYVLDMVAMNETTVALDGSQDWQLISSQTLNSGGSRITIQRSLETCDEQDYIFNSDLIHVLWNQNQTQEISSFQQFEINLENASHPIYFVDPIVKIHMEAASIQNFRISRKFLVPPRHTTYWCSLHKLNETWPSKRHIVGFSSYFDSELSRSHVHHHIVYRCVAPPGTNPETFFEPFVNHPGQECYIHERAELPYNFCKTLLFESSVGGFGAVNFSDVGFAIGGSNSPEYLLMETHFNNQELRDDLNLETGVDFQHSSQLRRNEGGILLTGYGVLGTFVIPPQSSDFTIAGHCNPQCTSRMFAPDGLDIMAVRLHGHLSTRSVRVKHYRGGVEKPFLQNDDNYDFNFQQWRWLINPVKVLPGDQITVQCGYDNTWRNDSSATTSGYSTRNEMCASWLLLSKRLDYGYCSSEYPTQTYMTRFGIQNMTWDVIPNDRIINSATDSRNVGLQFTQVVTNATSNWSNEQSLAFQNEQLYSEHDVSCPNIRVGAVLLHYLDRIEQLLPPGINLPLPQSFRDVDISDRTISTPMPMSKGRYMREGPEYRPPSVCPLNGGEQGVGIPTQTQGNSGGVIGDVLTRVRNIIPLLRFPFRLVSSS